MRRGPRRWRPREVGAGARSAPYAPHSTAARLGRGQQMNELKRRFLAHPRHGPLPLLLLVLMLVAGVLDAVTLLRLEVFVANMTGNTVIIGISLAGAPAFSLTASLTALVGFVVGVAALS